MEDVKRVDRSKLNKEYKIILILFFFLLFSLTGCNLNLRNRYLTEYKTIQIKNVRKETVFTDSDEIISLTWLDDKSFVYAHHSSDLFTLVNGLSKSMMISEFKFCNSGRTQYGALNNLPDGNISFLIQCIQFNIEGFRLDQTIGAFNPETNEIRQITDFWLPNISGFGSFSWNSTMTKGIVEAGTLYRTIYWITPNGAEPMNVIIEDNTGCWNLADNYWAMLDNSFEDKKLGIVYAASWSPDDNEIAFTASTKAKNYEGIARGSKEQNLYLMAVDDLKPAVALEGLYDINDIDWSPDGRWLAFWARYGRETSGLLIYERETGEVIRIYEGEVIDFDWSVDSNELAIIECNPMCNTISILDLTSITME